MKDVVGLAVELVSGPEGESQIVFDPPVILEIGGKLIFLEVDRGGTIREAQTSRLILNEIVETAKEEGAVHIRQARVRLALPIKLAAEFEGVIPNVPGGVVLHLIVDNETSLGEAGILTKIESSTIGEGNAGSAGSEARS